MRQRSYRELAAELERAGFVRGWGKGSHCKWFHPTGAATGMKFNHPGWTATPGAIKSVTKAIEEATR